MGILINCKEIQQELLEECRHKLREKKTFLIINDKTSPASEIYVANKVRLCEDLGIECTVKEKLEGMDIWFHDYVMVQKPCTPENEETSKMIPAFKDVDCLNARTLGELQKQGLEARFVPCTPKGIMEMIKRVYGLKWLDGKDVTIVGRSDIVGRPLAMLMEQANATVTLCHSHTKNLQEKCKNADVLVCAIGKPKFFTADYVKPGALVIDVGINRTGVGKIVGDVDRDSVLPVCEALTPVPGGVGLLTTASLMMNLTKEG